MSVVENYKKILDEVNKASKNLSYKVELLVVSKMQDVNKMEELVKYGVKLFGESKVQEAIPKINYLKGKYSDLNFHYIGKIQTNKLKKIVENFTLIHSVDREDILFDIHRYSLSCEKKQEILIQINIAEEKQKLGIELSRFDDMLEKASKYENVIVRGIMFFPPFEEDVSKNFEYFAKAQKIFNKYQNKTFNILSMGMSHDFREAINYGSTLVTVGSGIFADRKY